MNINFKLRSMLSSHTLTDHFEHSVGSDYFYSYYCLYHNCFWYQTITEKCDIKHVPHLLRPCIPKILKDFFTYFPRYLSKCLNLKLLGVLCVCVCVCKYTKYFAFKIYKVLNFKILLCINC